MIMTTTAHELMSHMAPKHVLCGIDLGTKTIGLSVSDTEFSIASPYHTIKRQKFNDDAQALANIVLESKIAGFVIGLPLNMDGSEGPRVQATRAFIRNLDKTPIMPNLPVIYWDERLSTVAVTRTLIDADTRRSRRAEVVDKMAAAFILQGFLDYLAHHPAP